MKASRFKRTIAIGRFKDGIAWIINSSVPACLIFALCVACSGQDEGKKIHALIAKGAALAEAHDTAGILELASRDVRAMPMDLDRRGIKAALWQTFNYYGPINIRYPRPTVAVNDAADEASAVFPFLILKKERHVPDLDKLSDDPMAWLEAIGKNVDLYRLQLLLTKQGGAWVVHRAFLERFAGMGFEE